MSPPTEGGASSPPQLYTCKWLGSCTLEVEEDMKKILLMGLPLVLLSLMLLYLATCVLGQGTDTCDPCDGSDDHIRLTDPSRNSSAGQIQVCHGNYWQTVCGATPSKQQIPRRNAHIERPSASPVNVSPLSIRTYLCRVCIWIMHHCTLS